MAIKPTHPDVYLVEAAASETDAATVLARRLGLDLYRVDVAAVLARYTGETEETLERDFAAGAGSGLILLFDEAEAHSGERSEVYDADEDDAGPAFLRRLAFLVDFPSRGEEPRARIWSTAAPERAAAGEVQPQRLGAVVVTGGTISNVARRSPYLAAADGDSMEMRHLQQGTQRELRKLGRDLSPQELAAWG